METTILGRTGLQVTRTAFGALPMQRISKEDAKTLLLRAYDAGITFYDTARAYSDSEEKLGLAFGDGKRKDVVIATKSGATDRTTLLKHLATSLKNLKTDYVDILQLHNPATLPDPDDPESSYAGMVEAKRKGMVRHIGITNHQIALAKEAVRSGQYETVQFPLCSISADTDLELIDICERENVGLIAMKALSGGLITNAAAAFAFLRQYPNVVPIWGVQRLQELEEFISLDTEPPRMDDAMRAVIAKDRDELSGNFCRACGYCLPCPQDIAIPMCARMSLLLRRAPYKGFLSDEWKARMENIENCIECGKCRERCPYGLDTPNLLIFQLDDYRDFYDKHACE